MFRIAGRAKRLFLQYSPRFYCAPVTRTIFRNDKPTIMSVIPEGGELSYLSDVEGDLQYFNRFIERSHVLKFDSADRQSISLRDGKCFAYGGDVFDRGPGDVRVARMLVALKQRYPDRVFLILGNRDLNKIRLASELHSTELSRKLSDIPGPYFIDALRRPNPSMFLKRLAGYPEKYDENLILISKYSDSEITPTAAITPEDEARLAPLNTPVNRLKYILQHTMAAPKAFEFRRQELAELTGNAVHQIADSAVFKSFSESILPGPDGFVYDYLHHAQLGLVFGDTLILHGGLCAHSKGYLPRNQPASLNNILIDDSLRTEHTHTVQQWIEALNSWTTKQLAHWRENMLFNADRSMRGGERLIGYANPKAMAGRTVVYNDFFENGNPHAVPSEVVNYLQRSGICRILVGHQPHGNCPTVIRTANFLAVDADTGYSDPSKPDGRGVACSEVIVRKDHVFVHGVLSNGREIEYSVGATVGSSTTTHMSLDPYVGLHTADDWWVKAKTKQSASSAVAVVGGARADANYLLSRGEGFTVSYRWHTMADLEAMTLI